MQPTSMRFKRIPRSATSQTKTVKLLRGDGGPIKPEIVPIEKAGIAATITEVVAGEEYELQVVLSPPWSSRQTRTNIKVKTGVDQAPDSTLIVVADVERRVKAMPDRLALPPQQDVPVTKTVKLVWAGDNPGKIIQASSSDPKLGVHVDEVDGVQKVIVEVPAGYELPRRHPSITIRTDDKESPTVNVPVRPTRTAANQNKHAADKKQLKTRVARDRKTSKPTTAKRDMEFAPIPLADSGNASESRVSATAAKDRGSTQKEKHSKTAKTAAIPASKELAGAKMTRSSNTATRDNQRRTAVKSTIAKTDLTGTAVEKPSSRRATEEKPAKGKPAPDHDHSGCGGHDDQTPGSVLEPAVPGTAPQWACVNTTVQGEPVWEGTYAKFVFKVSNPGSADLQVNVKRR